MMNGGAYTLREYPDGSVTRYWPDHDTRDWHPRGADYLASLRWLHPLVPTAGWLAALVGLIVAARRSRAIGGWRNVAMHPGTALIGFSLCFGAAVSFSHMTVVRYLTPILPFLWVATALLVTPTNRDAG